MVLLFQEITDYMNGTDAESDDPTGVSRNYVEFMITKEGKIEKTKPGSTTIYYVVKDNGSGFYIEKINKTDYDEENAQKPDSTIRRRLWNPTRPVGAYGTRPTCRRPWNPTLPSCRRLWNPTPPTQMFLVIRG
jgi:hypothetical protein